MSALVLAGVAGCSARRPHAEPAKVTAQATVTAGNPVTVADAARHLTVSAGPDVIPPGTVVIGPPVVDLPGTGAHDAASVVAGGAGPVRGEVELRFRVPDTASATATVAVFEEATRTWLPVPSARAGNDLVGTSTHLTTFGWFDDLRLVLGQAVGTRAAVPKCGTARPEWLRDLITTQGADAQVLACAEKSGADLEVTVVNNRPYPVALQLSAPPKSSAVDLSWPAGVRDLLDRALASLGRTGTSVALPPLGTVTLVYAEPRSPTIVTGHVRVGVPSAILTVLVGGILDTGLTELEVTVGGKPLGLSTLDCLAGAVSGVRDVLSLDPGRLAGVVQKFAGCVLGILDAERDAILAGGGTGERFTKLTHARDVFKVYTVLRAVEQLAEIGLDERPDIRDGVDLTLDLNPGPVTVAADHIGPFTMGMTVEQVRKAAGVALDHNDTCGYYTFRGEEGFGEGDGPTFFFDDAGRLRGMLLGASVFHRAVRADHGARIGSTLAELQKGYGAALIPPGRADAPNLAWVKGAAGTALGFDLPEGRVTGFRAGAEQFVTSLEFCG